MDKDDLCQGVAAKTPSKKANRRSRGKKKNAALNDPVQWEEHCTADVGSKLVKADGTRCFQTASSTDQVVQEQMAKLTMLRDKIGQINPAEGNTLGLGPTLAKPCATKANDGAAAAQKVGNLERHSAAEKIPLDASPASDMLEKGTSPQAREDPSSQSTGDPSSQSTGDPSSQSTGDASSQSTEDAADVEPATRSAPGLSSSGSKVKIKTSVATQTKARPNPGPRGGTRTGRKGKPSKSVRSSADDGSTHTVGAQADNPKTLLEKLKDGEICSGSLNDLTNTTIKSIVFRRSHSSREMTEEKIKLIKETMREALHKMDGDIIGENYNDIPHGSRCEKIKGMSQMKSIVNQVDRILCLQGIAAVTAGPGEGKTMASAMVLNYYVKCTFRKIMYYQRPQDIHLENISYTEEGWLVIIDNFLGKSTLDGFDLWRKFLSEMSYLTTKRSKDIRFLLVTRKEILEEAFQAYGVELVTVLGSHNIVSLQIDYGKMVDECYPKLGDPRTKKAIARKKSCIGMPLLCKLHEDVSQLSNFRTSAYIDKFLAFLLQFLDMQMQKNSAVKLTLALVAVSSMPFPKTAFHSPHSVNSNATYDSIEILEKFAHRQLTETDVKDMKHCLESECRNLLTFDGGYISFLSDVIKTAVLATLIKHDAEVLADVCDIKDFSHRFHISHESQEEDAQCVLISESTAEVFMDRVLQELGRCNFRYTLTSPLFKNRHFRGVFWQRAADTLCLEKLSHAYDREALHFAFWAAASSDLLEDCIDNLPGFTQWEVCQALVACCLWGREDDYQDLFHALDARVQDHIYRVTLEDIVTGKLDFAYEHERNTTNWNVVPFHKEDTLLTLAAWRGHREVVNTMLRNSPGLPIDIPGKGGRTILMHFCARADGDMIHRHLLDKCNPMQTDRMGNSPLHLACLAEGGIMPIRLLRLADVNATNKYGTTPLMYACERDSGQLPRKWYQHLIASGAKSGVEDQFGRSCLHFACASKNEKMIEVLAKATSGFSKDELYEFTPLDYVLLRQNNMGPVNTLLSRYGNKVVSVKSLLIATRYNDKYAVEKLAWMRNLKFDVVESLTQACLRPDLDMVQILIKKGQRVAKSETNFSLNCGMHAAGISGSVDVATFLLSKGAEVDYRDKQGMTPLMHSLQKGRREHAEFLINQGAELTVLDASKKTCLHHAAQSDSPELLDWFMEKHAFDINAEDENGGPPLLHAVELLCRRSTLWLLSKGADPTKVDSLGQTCLHKAAENGDVFLIKLFEGIGKNCADNQGTTPLMCACQGCHIEAVRYLQQLKD